VNKHTRGRKGAEAVQRERDVVLSILSSATTALTRHQVREEYARRVGSQLAYNTAKARLDELVENGRVLRSPSERRPVTYELAPAAAERDSHRESRQRNEDRQQSRLIATKDREAEIPLSAGAERVQRRLRRPRGERQPVGYDLQFLDAYKPGTTWYLDAPERARLNHLGRTTYMDQPAGTYARDIMQRLVIDLSWGSSHLEGLRYSRIDTEELLNAGRSPHGASDRDRQLILNHKAAIEFLVEDAQSIAFNRYTIMNLHALLAENLLDDRQDEGSLRTRPVVIGTSVYTPLAIPQVIEERFETLLAKTEEITDPIEQAFFIMVHLPYLQPFIDVNKRTSRLAANIPLIRANLCPLSFVDVPESVYTDGVLGVYELTDLALLRDVFVWAYERSCAQFKVLREAMREPDPIRLNYRTELRELVGDTVRTLSWPSDEELRARAARLGVPTTDHGAFAGAARKDLLSLRPDILARYSLRKSEYDRWSAAVLDRRGTSVR
jgi:hypothetical protein